MESAGEIQITSVRQDPIKVGVRDAFRLRHEYTLGKGNDSLSISQVSTLLILNGRGIVVTAYGRTELFHPMAASVEEVLRGLRVQVGGARPAPAPHELRNEPQPAEDADSGSQLQKVPQP